jgi:hypothetical protein
MKGFNEHQYADEALVAGDRNIVKAILNKLEDIMVDSLQNGNEEIVNNIARYARMKVTKKKQAKGKAFVYKLK